MDKKLNTEQQHQEMAPNFKASARLFRVLSDKSQKCRTENSIPLRLIAT